MIKIGFTGDFCPWRRVENIYMTGEWEKMFETVQPFFNANDLNILDLECPLTTVETKLKKTGPHIKANPKTVKILNYLNCEVVATANNHFKDYGVEGMEETYDTLKSNNINWLGSGTSFEEAAKTFYWEQDNTKFAFINITENEWTTTNDDSPGCHPIDLVNVYNQIKIAKKSADYVIIISHGGHELYELPSPRIKKWYRFFIDAGANAVIGHHTHIISGYEIYNDAPIFYSLGNFCFDWEGQQNSPWNKGMMVRLKFSKNKPIQFDLEFVNQNNQRAGVFILNEREKEITVKHLLQINEVINDDIKLDAAFKNYIKNKESIFSTWIQPYSGRYLPGLHKRGLLPSLISKEKKMLLTNLIRCEAHRDVLISVLNSKNV